MPFGLHDHPARQRVLGELHARPFTPLAVGRRLLHFAFQVTPQEAEDDRHIVEQRSGLSGRDLGSLNERYLLLDDGRTRWERHGEFVTYTFEVGDQAAPAWPSGAIAPGRLLVAIDLRLVAERYAPPRLVEAVVLDGDAHVSSDFLPTSDGFIEIEVVNGCMSAELAGATVQRVLELETYRCFALLSLPVAERATQAISHIEAELPDLMTKMDAATSLDDNRELLDRLTAMTLELERSSAATHFRFGASRAYAELVRLRLQALAEQHRPSRPGLTAFFSRRFDPAMRLCTTLSEREANLARKLTRAAQLLRTRVEIALQSQNSDLLAAMGDRVRLQLRLQRTVEGLSVAAVAYYVTGLLHYIVEGAAAYLPAADPATWLALAVPFIVIAVAATIFRIRHHHSDDVAVPTMKVGDRSGLAR